MSDLTPLLLQRSRRPCSVPAMLSGGRGHQWRHHRHRPFPWQSNQETYGQTEGCLRQPMFLERNSTWFLGARRIVSLDFSSLSSSKMPRGIAKVIMKIRKMKSFELKNLSTSQSLLIKPDFRSSWNFTTVIFMPIVYQFSEKIHELLLPFAYYFCSNI